MDSVLIDDWKPSVPPKPPARSRLVVELGPMLRLALPVVVAELGWMMMAVVDTVVVRDLGPEAIGAVGLGSSLFMAVAVFGFGLLYGLDTMVSQEHGAGLEREAKESLAQGVYLAVGFTPVVIGLIRGMVSLLPGWGISPEVIGLTVPYLAALSWSAAALMVFNAIRRYLQGVGVVQPITFALVSANLVNWIACRSLVYGKLGLPSLGVEGAGWATCLARLYMLVVLVAAYAWYAPGSKPFRGWPWPDFKRLWKLIALGFPAAIQVTLEVGVFATATALAGRLDATSLASHNIVLLISSVTYMVPLGIASAGAVRVGNALGRGDPKGSATSGWTAILIGAAFMIGSGLALLAFARPIIGVFTEDARVIETTSRLFLLAAAFQLFDGVQVVTTGVLRGTGDTRTSMACNLVAHWGIGLPLGYGLAFGMGRGIVGLWVGLSIGLTLAGLANLVGWARTARRLKAGEVALLAVADS